MNNYCHKNITIGAAFLSLLVLAIPLASHAQDNCDTIKASVASSGVRTEDSIRCVFVANRHALNDIYHEERKSTSTLEGDIELKLTLTPAGKADTSSSVGKTTTGNPGFEQKILAAVKGFDFGAAKDSFQTSYTVRFYLD